MKLHQWRRRRDEQGATAVEYALLATMIAGVIFAVVAAFGPMVGQMFVLNW